MKVPSLRFIDYLLLLFYRVIILVLVMKWFQKISQTSFQHPLTRDFTSPFLEKNEDESL